MSDSLPGLRRQISSVRELKSIVRAMKAMAAANIVPCENAVRALDGYARNVQLGLAACLRRLEPESGVSWPQERVADPSARTAAVVFGSDLGMVGQFNEEMACFVQNELRGLSPAPVLWPVGERVAATLAGRFDRIERPFEAAQSIAAITPLVAELLRKIHESRRRLGAGPVLVFYQKSRGGSLHQPEMDWLLPLPSGWSNHSSAPWPTKMLPETIGPAVETLAALLRERFFICLFRACAESLASENAARLAAMRRAERNIGDRLSFLDRRLNSERQSSIDAELADVISSCEVLMKTAATGL